MTDASTEAPWDARELAEMVAAARRELQLEGGGLGPAVANAGLSRPEPGVHVKRLRFSRTGAVESASKPGLYALATLLFVVAGIAGVWRGNVEFAPEMYAPDGLAPMAEALAAGQNYAVFDLNLNVRRLRAEHVARFKETPEVVVLGASHWQEAHAGLVKSRRMYNGHVHRDYWEDMLGVVEVYARNGRLPKQMIVSVRDNLFTPLENRTDYLWEAGIEDYRAMANRLGLEEQEYWKTLPIQRVKERLSLTLLFKNASRWFHAAELPHASAERSFDSLDTLLPDGSILWSARHKAAFTQARAESEAIAFAGQRRDNPPKVDPQGLAAFDKLLGFLKRNGTEVVLAHPPFNPVYYERVKGGTYLEGLDKIREVTRQLAAKHGLHIIGGFDPAQSGCTAAMFIDAEHGNPACLVNIFRQFDALNAAKDAAQSGAQS